MSAAGRAWIDGGSRGNPGPAGFGVLFETDGGREEIVGFLGKATNNVAEYAGLIAALTRAKEAGLDRLEICSDSELLVRQLQGRYKVKAPHLIPMFLHALKLRQGFPTFKIRHVPRAENSLADGLANRAIDERSPLPAWLHLPKLG